MSLRCPACGATYPPNAHYCPKDGTALEEAAAARSAGAAPGHARVFPSVAMGGPAPAAASPVAEAPAFDPLRLPGRVLDGRYHVERKVGEGGMAHVFLAIDGATGERVAVKLLSPALVRDGTAMERLRREAEIGGRLAHPNVCHIMRLGETGDGIVYIVMPYIEGELLCDRTFREGQLAPAAVARFVRDIAAGLAMAHAHGVIHRDLKPENVMIVSDGRGGERAVVMDFGLAKQRRVGPEVRKLTATGIVLGTPEFMSPEQLRGKPLDARSDLYALGLMACEMLTGRLPFSGSTQQEVMIARLKGAPTPLGSLRPDLRFPKALERVIARSLQRDPENRYATAPEFAEAFAQAVD